MGREVVLHATATGKAWLATLPEDEALRLVVARGFPVPRHADPGTFGKGVVRTIDELRAHLRETRRRGYALADRRRRGRDRGDGRGLSRERASRGADRRNRQRRRSAHPDGARATRQAVAAPRGRGDATSRRCGRCASIRRAFPGSPPCAALRPKRGSRAARDDERLPAAAQRTPRRQRGAGGARRRRTAVDRHARPAVGRPLPARDLHRAAAGVAVPASACSACRNTSCPCPPSFSPSWWNRAGSSGSTRS